MVIGFEAGAPVEPRRRRTWAPHAAHHRGRAAGRRHRVRAPRHGREPPGRHQEPRGLRVPGRARPAGGPCRPRGPDPRAGPAPREAAARAALVRAGLRRHVVLAPQGGARRLHRRVPAARHRRGPPALRAAGHAVRWSAGAARSPSTTTAWPPTTSRTPSATPTPRDSCDSGGCPSPPGPPVRAPDQRGASNDTVAGPSGRGDVRRRGRVHGLARLRPGPGRRRPGLARGPMWPAWARWGSSTTRRSPLSWPPSTRWRPRWPTAPSPSRPGDEDIHTAVERRVTELAGDVGAKLHTGRSRNDQVATDLRLWTRRALAAVLGDVLALQDVLLSRATEAGDAYLPGYTHLQRGPAGAAGPPPAGPRLGPGP